MPAKLPVLDRLTIPDQVHRLMLERILDGRLSPGESLNEARLAAELGVSRTPLREALSRLRQSGLVVARPHRGFFVAPVTLSEARELYELLALLEADALELAGVPDPDPLEALRRLNRKVGEAQTASEVIEVNTIWHRTLVTRCGNACLLELIENVRRKLLRYEYRYFAPGESRIRASVALHEKIIDCLARGDLRETRNALREHWLSDLDGFIRDAEGPSSLLDPHQEL